MNFIDLFCGAGGFSYGLIKAGLTHEFGVDSCVDSKDIQQTYETNCGHLIKESVERFDGKPYEGKIDVVVGSPPCKSFSVANTKTRNMDTTLIKEFLRIVYEIKPKVWVWENVNGVLHKLTKQHSLVDDGRIHDGFWKSFNMADYGMMQMRKRTFVSNIKLDIPKPIKIFIDGQHSWNIIMHDRGNIIKPFYTITAHGSIRGGNFGLKTFEKGIGMRHLLIEEQAWIQTFPFYYQFFGSNTSKEIQIGNSVPPHFSYLIGKELIKYG